jgi:4-oxalocrotonate tautomerase
MPLIDVSLAEGRSPAMVRELIDALTDAAVASLGAPRETVRVIIRPVSLDHWANGGVTLREKRAASSNNQPSDQENHA